MVAQVAERVAAERVAATAPTRHTTAEGQNTTTRERQVLREDRACETNEKKKSAKVDVCGDTGMPSPAMNAVAHPGTCQSRYITQALRERRSSRGTHARRCIFFGRHGGSTCTSDCSPKGNLTFHETSLSRLTKLQAFVSCATARGEVSAHERWDDSVIPGGVERRRERRECAVGGETDGDNLRRWVFSALGSRRNSYLCLPVSAQR